VAYLERRGYSPHTVKNYAVDLHLFFEAIQPKTARQVRRAEIERFLEVQHTKRLNPNTITRRLFAIKTFFEFLIEQQGWRGENPIRKTVFPRRRKPLPRPCRADEIQQLFGVIADPWDKGMFTLMLRCGLRVSEVATLRLRDLDCAARTLFIRQGKGRKDRVVYLSEDAVDILSRCLQAGGQAVTTEYVFFNKKDRGRGLTANAIQKKLERYCRAASITLSCHQLRHTFAKGLLDEGTGIMTIKNLLGHESVLTSERYARLSDAKVKQEYFQAMAKILQEHPL